jgi:hypothetical protein
MWVHGDTATQPTRKLGCAWARPVAADGSATRACFFAALAATLSAFTCRPAELAIDVFVAASGCLPPATFSPCANDPAAPLTTKALAISAIANVAAAVRRLILGLSAIPILPVLSPCPPLGHLSLKA